MVRVHVDVAGEVQVLEADAVLVATGRRPATAALDCDAAGIALDESGAIVVDEHLRTSAPGVWALADPRGVIKVVVGASTDQVLGALR